MTIIESIVWGVVSGICTSFILFILIQVFRNILLPWYRNLVYSGISVDGEWLYDSVEPFVVNMSLQLQQSANKINGTVTFINIAKTNDIKSFIITGNVKDRLIQLIGNHSEKSKIGSAVFMLEVIADGTILRGGICYYDILHSIVTTFPVCFAQKGTDKSIIEQYTSGFNSKLSRSVIVE